MRHSREWGWRTHIFFPLCSKRNVLEMKQVERWFAFCHPGVDDASSEAVFWSRPVHHAVLYLLSRKKKQTNTTDYMASKPQGCVSQSLKLGGPRSRCLKVWCLLRGPLLRSSPWRLSQTCRFWGGTNAWYNTATVTVVSISKKGPCPLWKGKTSLESERQTSKINFYDTSST